MDLERYFELRTILQRWRILLAESIRRRVEASPRLARRVERIYNREGTDEPFNVWLDRWCRQAAIQFILRILFLRVLEDRELLGATRIWAADGQRMWAQLTRNLGATSYIQFCFWDAAHLLPDLFEPSDCDLALPADDLVQRYSSTVRCLRPARVRRPTRLSRCPTVTRSRQVSYRSGCCRQCTGACRFPAGKVE